MNKGINLKHPSFWKAYEPQISPSGFRNVWVPVAWPFIILALRPKLQCSTLWVHSVNSPTRATSQGHSQQQDPFPMLSAFWLPHSHFFKPWRLQNLWTIKRKKCKQPKEIKLLNFIYNQRIEQEKKKMTCSFFFPKIQMITKNVVIQDTWVAQWWASAFGSGCDPMVLGSSPTSGFLRGACFSLCLCLSASFSVSLMNK